MRHLRASAAAVFVVLAAVALPEVAPSALPVCTQAWSWVQENLERLPTNAEEFAQFHPTYRKYIFDALSPETSAELVREFLREGLHDATLSSHQRELIGEVYRFTTPALYSGSEQHDSVVEARKELEERLRQSFSMDQWMQLSLYRPSSQNLAPGAGMGLLPQFLRSQFTVTAFDGHACACADHDYCYFYCRINAYDGGNCTDEYGCVPTTSGCGWTWTQPCWGDCHCFWW